LALAMARKPEIAQLRAQFPALRAEPDGRRLVWLDNAATTQKPQAVIDAVTAHYARGAANVHRAGHELAVRATTEYEAARATAQRFVRAAHSAEIVFVRGATEGINLVAASWGGTHVQAGDALLVTAQEHHSNLVPWQRLAAERGATLRVLPVDGDGALRLDLLPQLLDERTRLVAVTWLSNALGIENDVATVVAAAHARGARVLVDAAQAAAHRPIDVQALGCDFLALSGHKVYGPTGAGVLYGKRELLEAMPPWQSGGEMVRAVRAHDADYQPPPHRFEAGTPDVAAVLGLGAALRWVQGLGFDAVQAHERAVYAHARERLARVPGLRLLGRAPRMAGAVAFTLRDVDADDVMAALDEAGIAVRSGHHCAEPLHGALGLASSVRASLAVYNDRDDVDALAAALERIG
jgi:cysteine desulfurase/selenocysteine lyase